MEDPHSPGACEKNWPKLAAALTTLIRKNYLKSYTSVINQLDRCIRFRTNRNARYKEMMITLRNMKKGIPSKQRELHDYRIEIVKQLKRFFEALFYTTIIYDLSEFLCSYKHDILLSNNRNKAIERGFFVIKIHNNTYCIDGTNIYKLIIDGEQNIRNELDHLLEHRDYIVNLPTPIVLNSAYNHAPRGNTGGPVSPLLSYRRAGTGSISSTPSMAAAMSPPPPMDPPLRSLRRKASAVGFPAVAAGFPAGAAGSPPPFEQNNSHISTSVANSALRNWGGTRRKRRKRKIYR
jgi:hypothetical protein